MIRYFRFALFNVSTTERKNNRSINDIPLIDSNSRDHILKKHEYQGGKN
jgi:hypothetical protein